MSCVGVMRVILVIINLLFAVLGLAFVVVGFILRFGSEILNNYINLQELADNVSTIGSSYGLSSSSTVSVDSLLLPIALFLILFGFFLLIVGIFGMIGACCRVKCMLIVYIIIVALITLAEIIIFIMLLTNFAKNEVKSYLDDKMKNNYKGFDDFSLTGMAMSWLMIQKQCCGVDDFNIFNESTVWEKERTYSSSGYNATVYLVTPIPCCKFTGTLPSVTLDDESCAWNPNATNNNFETGCYGKIESDIDSNKNAVIGAFVGLIVFTGLCLLMAILILRNAIKDNDDEFV